VCSQHNSSFFDPGRSRARVIFLSGDETMSVFKQRDDWKTGKKIIPRKKGELTDRPVPPCHYCTRLADRTCDAIVSVDEKRMCGRPMCATCVPYSRGGVDLCADCKDRM
jgi:hypothetical protein